MAGVSTAGADWCLSIGTDPFRSGKSVRGTAVIPSAGSVTVGVGAAAATVFGPLSAGAAD
jgi:hypothetical protein